MRKLARWFIVNRKSIVSCFAFTLAFAAFAAFCSVSAFASGDFDAVQTTITTGIGDTLTSLIGLVGAIIAAAIGGVLTILGLKLAVTKGIGLFKSLTGKAG